MSISLQLELETPPIGYHDYRNSDEEVQISVIGRRHNLNHGFNSFLIFLLIQQLLQEEASNATSVTSEFSFPTEFSSPSPPSSPRP
ncbi:hypothetical protein O181_056938 [Austropuccinia psidii MF-1]|uniref:Uncharacterized protein n=1 Tax=Austropuccinia psidii MF-1 TaxID=1389203 RepID=A0A9Q3HTZ0_9BASI|nr:hypothetical protein [Austropuccinia psidii MF-1]